MVTRKIVQNFSFLVAGKTLGHIATFILFVFLSKAFGQEGIGLYSIAMALTGFFAVAGDFGLNPYSIKELSRSDTDPIKLFSRILSLRLALLVVVLGALSLTLPFLGFQLESKLIILVIGIYQLAQVMADGLAAMFISRKDSHLAGGIEATFRVVAAVAAIIIASLGGSLLLAVSALPLAAMGQVICSYWVVNRRYGRPILKVTVPSLWRIMREASPYALSRFLAQLYTRADVVLLGLLMGAVAAGIYNVAYRVVFLLSFIPQFAATAVFPHASELYVTSKKEFAALYHNSLNLIIIIGLPIAAGLWIVAPDLISLIFGGTFGESALILRLLSGLLLLMFLSRMMGVFLMSCNRQVDRTKIFVVVATTNVLGNLILIPVLGIAGAAIAALASEMLLVISFMVRLKDVVGWPKIRSRLVIGAVGVASFSLPLTFLPSLSLSVVIPASASLYLAVLFLSKETRQNEVNMLLSLLKR